MRLRVSRSFGFTLLCVIGVACGSADDSTIFTDVPGSGGASTGGSATATGGTTTQPGSGGSGTATGGTDSTGGVPSGEAGAPEGGENAQAGVGPGEGGTDATGGADAAGAAGENVVAKSCKTNLDCAKTEYCKKTTCGAVNGTCQNIPTQCSNAEVPVCGCDGFNYANTCLAALNSQNVRKVGACTDTAIACNTQAACSARPNAVCAYFYLQAQQCPKVDVRVGSCWVMPEVCAEQSEVNLRACGTGHACSHLCKAAKTGDSYYLSPCN